MKDKLMAVWVCVLMLMSGMSILFSPGNMNVTGAGGTFGGGDGTPGNPYLIEDALDLQAMSGNLNAHYALANDVDASATAGWNSGTGFVPVGTSGTPFAGGFDGRNFTISGLFINRIATDYVGLFGSTVCRLSNVSLAGCSITGQSHVGGIAGYVASDVDNCHAEGNIAGSGTYIGGLVGEIENGNIYDCSAKGSVLGGSYVGGLVGFAQGAVFLPGSVTRSYAESNVAGTYNVGVLVGRNYAIAATTGSVITECYARGTASGIYSCGGMVGNNTEGTISDCYSWAEVTRTSGTNPRVGGFMGENYRGDVNNCYSNGRVIYADAPDPTDKGFAGYITTGGSYDMTGTYWDNQTSLQASSAGGAIGKNTTAMKTQATFAGWDFATVWWMVESFTYPILTWQSIGSPIAEAGPDQAVPNESTVYFDGTGTYDNIGIGWFNWTFMYNSTLQTLYGPAPSFEFSLYGTYLVTLNATNAIGLWDTDTMTVTILDVTAPIADAGPDQNVDEGTTVVFNGSLSSDDKGIAQYYWNFTDETPITLTGIYPTYNFTTPGIYNVTLETVDAAGNRDLDWVYITVNDIYLPRITDTTAGFAVNGQDFTFACLVKESSIGGVFLNYSIDTIYGTDGPFNVTMEDSFRKDVSIPQYARKVRYSMHVSDNAGSWASTPEKEIDVHSTDAATILYNAEFTPNPGPDAIADFGMDYDSHNDNIFVYTGTWPPNTWTYDVDERKFSESAADPTPPYRASFDMVYDSDTMRMIVFGGFSNNQIFEYEPATENWYGPFTPAGGPPATTSHSMAYDPVNQVVIVFGGNQGGTTSRNTWEYHSSGRYWTGPYANPGMPARNLAAMEYDPTIQRTVLFGGAYVGYLSDTWEYDSTYHAWTGPYNPAIRPSGRFGAEMVFNPITGRMVLFGGANDFKLSDTWEYDSSKRTWMGPYNPANKPMARASYGMAYDTQTDNFIIFGGENSSAYSSISEGYHDYSPVARAGTNIFVDKFEPFSIEDMASSDDYSVTNYTWTYDDGGVKTLWGPSHRVIITIPGSYIFELNVTDTRGQWDRDWILVTVNDTNGPVANAGVDQIIIQGDFIVSDGSGSWDDVGITSYTWTFMDGTLQTLTGVEWLWFFNNAGTFIVTLNVTDADGNWDTDIMVVTVIDTTPPIAHAGLDQTVDEDSPMMFDGSLSSDNVGVVNYTWTFADSGTKTLWGVSPIYTFTNPGVYSVTLTVRDAMALQDTDIVLINVNDITPPVITDTTAGWPVNGQMFTVTCYIKDNFSTITSVFINYSFVTAYGTVGPFNVTMNGTYYKELQIPQYARTIQYSIYAVDSCGWLTKSNKNWDAKSNEAATLLYSGALNPSPRPTARAGHGMDYNPDIDGMVIYGGNGGNDGITWIYDANNHTYYNPAPSPYPLSANYFDLAFDSVNRRTTMFGGFPLNNRVYEYDATSNIWSGPFTPAGPPTMYGHSMAYDPVNEVMVVFGGLQGGVYSRNTWEYHPEGRYWTGPYSNPSMAARYSPAMEWDPTIQKMVMFGGFNSPVSYSDVWEYDTNSHTWTGPINPVTRPGVRYAMEMSYIPTTGHMVMFGGISGSSTLSDTWEYDASEKAWLGPYNPTNKPVARNYYGMAYDSQSDIFVIHGGINSAIYLSDINEGHYDYSPVSRAGPNLFINEGAPLSFSGAASTDDVAITNYTWTFDDGGAKTLWGTNPSYTFTTPGTYLINLTVKDARNQWDSDWILVTVNSTETTISIPLLAGWNLVSIPLDLDNTTVEYALASIAGKWDVAKCFDALDAADPWKTFRVGSAANDLLSLDRTMGFWLHTTEACWLNVTGNLTTSTAIDLHAGWNLVGYPTTTEMAVSAALAGTGYDAVEGFMASSPYIQSLDGAYLMKPGEGYWVHVPADTTWTVNW